MFDKGAEADALHPAPHHNMASDGGFLAHARCPVSMTRAPVQRDTDQRATERI
jgi:hypothetical protein